MPAFTTGASFGSLLTVIMTVSTVEAPYVSVAVSTHVYVPAVKVTLRVATIR